MRDIFYFAVFCFIFVPTGHAVQSVGTATAVIVSPLQITEAKRPEFNSLDVSESSGKLVISALPATKINVSFSTNGALIKTMSFSAPLGLPITDAKTGLLELETRAEFSSTLPKAGPHVDTYDVLVNY